MSPATSLRAAGPARSGSGAWVEGHFRSDASYLPDLEAYLADLLRNRERIRAATIDADEWARAEATPSDEEIERVRRLIRRISAELDDLTDAPTVWHLRGFRRAWATCGRSRNRSLPAEHASDGGFEGR